MNKLNIDFTNFVVIEKDRHIKNSIPYNLAHRDYNNFIVNSDINQQDHTYISLGDVYDKATPSPEDNAILLDFINRTNFDNYIFIRGNHDYNRITKALSIAPLEHIGKKKIFIITEPTEITFTKYKILCLPHIYSNSKISMEDIYSNIPEEFCSPDMVCYHFEDETINFGKDHKGIDISYIKGFKEGGHIHTIQKNYTLGMPINSRSDEAGQDNFLRIINVSDKTLSKYPIPKFIDFYPVNYPDDLPKVDAKYPIFEVNNAINRKLVFEKYPQPFYYSKINKAKLITTSNYNSNKDKKSISEYFDDFLTEKNPNIPKETVVSIKSFLNKREKI